MKKKLALALLIVVTLFALAFSVSNFIAPVQAAPVTIFGTKTYAPWLDAQPFNWFCHIEGSYYCILTQSDCSVTSWY